MKKTLIAAALLTLVACNKENPTTNPEVEYGYINLGLSADTEIVVTKGITSDATLTGYNLTLHNQTANTDVWTNQEYSVVSADNSKWRVPKATYSIYVENLTDAEAHPADGKGQVRVTGETKDIEVNAGETRTATVTCTPVNSKISFAYTPSFGAAFQDGATISVTDGTRKVSTLSLISLNAEDANSVPADSDAAYYPAGKTLTWTLKATNKSGTAKEYTGTFTTVKAQWTSIKFAGGSNGQLNVTVTVDNEIETQVVEPVTIDPFENE